EAAHAIIGIEEDAGVEACDDQVEITVLVEVGEDTAAGQIGEFRGGKRRIARKGAGPVVAENLIAEAAVLAVRKVTAGLSRQQQIEIAVIVDVPERGAERWVGGIIEALPCGAREAPPALVAIELQGFKSRGVHAAHAADVAVGD